MPRDGGDSHGLHERNLELARIRAAIERLREGSGAMVVVEGEPGIGKTALLRAAREIAAEHNVGTLPARARELEREFPFGVVRQLLEPPLRALAADERDAVLAGTASHGAVALGFTAGDGAADPGYAVLNGLYQVLANLSEREPLLLTLDDAQWADPASMRLLAFVATRLPDLRALLLVAGRSGDWGSASLLATTSSDPGASPLALAALSADATAEIVGSRLGGGARDPLARACYAASAGNPFYLHAVLDELRRQSTEPGEATAADVADLRPPAVAKALVARLSTLSPATTPYVEALAVLGDGAEPDLVAALAGIRAGDAPAASDELARAAILDYASELRFAHPITRNAVVQGIGPGRRLELHRQAAELLARRGAAVERVAAQLLVIPPAADAAAVATLRRAAAEATRRGSADSAATYLRRAIAEPPADSDFATTLLELGLAESVTDVVAAVEHLRQSLELSAEPRQRALIAAMLARTLFFADRTADAIAVARPALDWLDPDADRELGLQLSALTLAAAGMEPGQRPLARELAARGRAAPARTDSFGAKALAAGALYVDARAGIPAAEAVARARRALEGGLLLSADNGRPASMTAVMVLTLADSELVLPALEHGFARAREKGDTFAIAGNMIFRCQARLVRGELAAAVADGEAGLAASDASGIAVALPWGCGFLAAAQLERGDLDAAARTLARAAPGGDVPETANWHGFLLARAELMLRRGEHRPALEAALDLGRRFEAVGGRNPAFVPWRSLVARCLVALGEEPQRARALASEELALARAWAAPRTLGAALWTMALATGPEPGIKALREADALLSRSPARLEHARVRVELGAALARGGSDDGEARELLERGLRDARRCGAVPLVERAYADLELIGAHPRRIVATGVDALTPSERRTAELAASGLTNREIAERLFVTVKTVEFHLAGTYRKLDIGARAQLSAALGRGELQPSA